MSISYSGIPTSRRLAWYAIDVERPAIDVPGLKENLYKLRETRRMLFDRDSRPYFGDLAEAAESGAEVPVLGPPDNRGPAAPAFRRRHLCCRAQRLERWRGLMSEATMAEVFGAWWSDRPPSISVKLAPGADPVAVRQELNKSLIGPWRGDHHPRVRVAASGRTGRARRRSATSRTLGFVMGVMIGMGSSTTPNTRSSASTCRNTPS